VDERWACPKCGFNNEYYATFCVSCNETQPTLGSPSRAEARALSESTPVPAPVVHAASTPVPAPVDAPAPPSDACQVCGRTPTAVFSFKASVGMVFMRRTFEFDGRLCRACAKGQFRHLQGRNLAWGWFGLISFAATIAYAIGNLRDYRRNMKGLGEPIPSDPVADKRLAGRPVILKALPGLAVVAVVIGIGAALATADIRAESRQPYIDDIRRVNSKRTEVVKLANSRAEVWSATSQDPVPSARYLVAAELDSLQRDVNAMIWPKSDELLALHMAWVDSVQKLAAAEKKLAQENSQANYQADIKAWTAEEAAFKPLFEYCSGRT
jgi:hypothetical protein